MSILILFSFWFGRINVHAEDSRGRWPLASQKLVFEQNLTAPGWHQVSNPYLLTMVDQVRLKAGGWGRVIKGSRFIELLKNSSEFKRPDGTPAGLRVRLWPNAVGQPLAVYLPGIFQGAVDEDTSRVVQTFKEAGYHVVVLPNPLSAEYFANFPVAPPNAITHEASVVSQAIAELAEMLRAPRIRVVAASYGAALGVRAWAADQNSPRPLIDDLTLLFPQVDLGRTIALVDASIAVSPMREPARAAVGRAYSASLRNLVRRLRGRFNEDAAAGFRARAYDETAAAYLTDRRPMPTGPLNLHEVMRHFVNFGEVIHEYGSNQAILTYWLERGHAARGNTRVRLLTAADDWTNAPDAWSTLPEWLRGPEHSLMLTYAGHAGVVSQEWFRRIILESMRD